MVLSRRGPARNAHADSARPARGHRSTWRDPRLTGGLVLIGAYVRAGQLPESAVAQRSLSAGELLPISAVGSETSDDLRAVVLKVSSGLPVDTGVGDAVDLWALPAAQVTADDERTQAEVIAEHLIVSTGSNSRRR